MKAVGARPSSPPQRAPRRSRWDVRGPVVRLVKDTRTEIRKVSWPSREETTRLAIIVVVLCITMGLFLGVVVDGVFFWIYRHLIGL